VRECEDCGTGLVTKTRWERTPPDERRHLRESGLNAHAGRGLCKACYGGVLRQENPRYPTKIHAWNEVWDESEFMYGLGMTEQEIAMKLGIKVASLRRSRQRYLERQAA
jgi:hypothetical protein